MNDQTIQMIAQAIIANTKVIQSLIDALPRETVEKVAEVVAPQKVGKKAEVQAEVQAPTPAPTSAPEPEPTPAPVAAPVMPPPPTFEAKPAEPVSDAPFKNSKELVDYVMAVYKEMGPRGQKIQEVLIGLGHKNINDFRPEQYGAVYAAIEAIRK